MPKKCTSRYSCFSQGCNEKHHTSLHEHFQEKRLKKDEAKERKIEKIEPVVEKKVEEVKEVPEKPAEDDQVPKDIAALHLSTDKDVYLWIVPVKLTTPNGQSFSTHALLDNGSQSTLLREDVAKKLQLHGRHNSVNVGTILESQQETFGTKSRLLSLHGMARIA